MTEVAAPTTNRQPPANDRQSVIAWQGWRFAVRPRWAPVKLDGDYRVGSMVVADLAAPKLVVRWKQVSAKADPQKSVRGTMREDVGQLAADEAKPLAVEGFEHGLLYEDPRPPGRDVWLGYSSASRRVVSLSYHARRRDRVLAGELVPTLAESPAGGVQEWSIFDLSFRLPRPIPLLSHRLNAGDLGLTFTHKRTTLTVRQIGPASLALGRMPLERWLADQETRIAKHYRPVRGQPQPAAVETLNGLSRASQRRRRYAWVWWFAKEWMTYVLKDEARDRLVIVQSTDATLAMHIASSVGQRPISSLNGERE
jgi:hypothetical protein